MDITLDKKNSTEGLIKIKLNAGDYQQKVDQKIQDYARKANIKGFRKGKVPAGIIRNLYGKSIKVEEINHLVSHSLNDYIKENDIQIIGDPIPEKTDVENLDWDNQTDFEFDFAIGMVGDFKYDLSQKIKVKKHLITVDDSTISSTLEDVKRQYGQMTNPEIIEEGDSLYGEFLGVPGEEEGKNLETLIDLTEVEKKALKGFIGRKKDDTVTIDLKAATKDPIVVARWFKSTIDEAKSRKGSFDFKIKNINRTIPADLNQELYDRVFGKNQVKSDEEFKTKLGETVQQNYDRESVALLDRHVREKMLKDTRIDTPNEFLKRWLLHTNEGLEEKDLEENFDHYVEDLKWNLISNRIVKDQSVKVENEEVIAEARNQIMAQLGGPSVAEAYKEQLDRIVQNFLQAENGQNYLRIHNQIRDAKILDVIKSKITVVDKKVKLDEFKKIATA